MNRLLIGFLLLLAILGILLKEDYVLVVLYLFVGTYLFGHWWGRRIFRTITVRRHFNTPIFLGEQSQVQVQVRNRGWLPVPWLQLRESLPVGLGFAGPFQRLAMVGPKGALRLGYTVDGIRRGYYPLGPLDLFSGDVMGLAATQRLTLPVEYLTVFPKIVPLTQVPLASHTPLGALRHHHPVYEDPSRPRGKRDYQAGDSIRRVDWKASAAAGRLQVKLFEPSMALEALIGLDLDPPNIDLRTRYSLTELSIVVTASLANWISGKRQAVGLLANGLDPAAPDSRFALIPPRRGAGQLLRVLETLARLQAPLVRSPVPNPWAADSSSGEARVFGPSTIDASPPEFSAPEFRAAILSSARSSSASFVDLLQQHMSHLPWGTVLVLISSQIDDRWFDSLFQARRLGLSAFLVWCGPSALAEAARQKAGAFGFPFQQVFDERDLDLWRQ